MIVEQVTVNIHIPYNEVRVVAMQPFIQLHSTTEEPFRWADHLIATQLNAITRTLDLAQDGFGGRTANFVLFPEYSVPGLDGASLIDNRITNDNWGNESIIIAGIDGLNKDEYSHLCQELTVNVSPENSPSSVPDGQWVNCCITWIKDHVGRVQKWVQPKIQPSWPEMRVTCHDMFCGSNVYVFKGQYTNDYPCNFFSLICYDWVAAHSGTSVCEEVIKQLNEKWKTNALPEQIHWVFVIQHNPEPNHPLFLNSTYRFLTDPVTYPFVDRTRAVVLHANTAVSLRPARSGPCGFTACIFSPSAQLDCTACRPTVCTHTNRLRGNNNLLRCKDVIFREMGECIHLFKIRVPNFIIPDATDRTFPLLDAEVHGTSEVNDPRLSGRPVPAALKWINDSLDCINPIAIYDLANCPLNTVAESVQLNVISDMRILDGHSAVGYIKWATSSFSRDSDIRSKERQLNADLWDQLEMDALEHVIYSMISLGLTYELDIAGSSMHGTLNSETDFVQIVAIRGESHTDCRRHYDNNIPKHGMDPVLVITRDRNNFKPTVQEYSKIYDVTNENGLRFVDYQSLVTCCREAEDTATLRRCLDEFIPRDRRII